MGLCTLMRIVDTVCDEVFPYPCRVGLIHVLRVLTGNEANMHRNSPFNAQNQNTTYRCSMNEWELVGRYRTTVAIGAAMMLSLSAFGFWRFARVTPLIAFNRDAPTVCYVYLAASWTVEATAVFRSSDLPSITASLERSCLCVFTHLVVKRLTF